MIIQSLTQQIKLFVTLAIACIGPVSAENVNETVLIENMPNIEALPKRFRTTDDRLKKQKQDNSPSLVGLKELRASASGQFSKKSFQFILKTLHFPKHLYVVDLREESHGFLNGIAVSLYAPKDAINVGKSFAEIMEAEKYFLAELSAKKQVTVYQVLGKSGTGYINSKKAITIPVEAVFSEEEMVKSFQAEYLRLPVTDHEKPQSKYVDQFIKFITSLPADAWVHFHCAGGMGRSTTFLAMYDMMKNAQHVPLQDILRRQWLLGGYRFEELPETPSWKYDAANIRLTFVKLFYQYCKENPTFNKPWTDFIAAQ